MADGDTVIKERIEDRGVNFVQVIIGTESGCRVADGEYSVFIIGLIGELDIHSYGGVDDVSLIKDCIVEHIREWALPEEGTTEVILKESGEWEDVFWNKYYVVERIGMAVHYEATSARNLKRKD